MTFVRSPLRDIVVGKIRGEWNKFRVGGKIFFKCFAFSRKTFAFPRETLRSLAKLKKKKYLREKAKVLRGNAKFLEGKQKFCERTQSFSRERKSFARERKVSRGNAKVCERTQKFCERTQNIWKIFFPPTLNCSTHSDFFPPQCPLKGSVPLQLMITLLYFNYLFSCWFVWIFVLAMMLWY